MTVSLLSTWLNRIGIILVLFGSLLATPEVINFIVGIDRIQQFSLSVRSGVGASRYRLVEFLSGPHTPWWMTSGESRWRWAVYIRTISLVVIVMNTIALSYLAAATVMDWSTPVKTIALLFAVAVWVAYLIAAPIDMALVRVKTSASFNTKFLADCIAEAVIMLIFPVYSILVTLWLILAILIYFASTVMLILTSFFGERARLRKMFLLSGILLFISGMLTQFVATFV